MGAWGICNAIGKIKVRLCFLTGNDLSGKGANDRRNNLKKICLHRQAYDYISF